MKIITDDDSFYALEYILEHSEYIKKRTPDNSLVYVSLFGPAIEIHRPLYRVECYECLRSFDTDKLQTSMHKGANGETLYMNKCPYCRKLTYIDIIAREGEAWF